MAPFSVSPYWPSHSPGPSPTTMGVSLYPVFLEGTRPRDPLPLPGPSLALMYLPGPFVVPSGKLLSPTILGPVVFS